MPKTFNDPYWPWPPPSGPTPWTRKQIKQYAKQQREKAGEAPL